MLLLVLVLVLSRLPLLLPWRTRVTIPASPRGVAVVGVVVVVVVVVVYYFLLALLLLVLVVVVVVVVVVRLLLLRDESRLLLEGGHGVEHGSGDGLGVPHAVAPRRILRAAGTVHRAALQEGRKEGRKEGRSSCTRCVTYAQGLSDFGEAVMR
jgi:hypothetical protein